MNAVKKFFILWIDSDSGYTSFDDIIKNAMDDPKFVKMYPIIANQNLLEELIRFITLPPKKIKGIGIANGEIFKKESGRQISGSHRYWGVQEENETYNIYKKFKGGPLDGQTWLILRIQDESYRTTKFILEHAKMTAVMPRIRDIEDYFSSEKILVCRDRIEIVLNHCHDAVNICNKKTNTDYDVTNLSSLIPQQENQNPSSNKITNTVVTQQPKQSQSSSSTVSLDNTGRTKPSKRLAKTLIINTMPLEPVITPVVDEPQQQPDTMKCGTPLINRLRKRKTTVLLVTKGEDNSKSAKSNSSECTGSSLTSKKRRRK